MLPGTDHLTVVYDPDEWWGIGGSWPYLDAVDLYARTFRLSGSYKEAYDTFDDGLLMPEESFGYEIGLYNASAYDREILLEDTLPSQVQLDYCDDYSMDSGATLGCNTGTNFVSWEGILYGENSIYPAVWLDLGATADAGLAPDSLVKNSAKVYIKDHQAAYGTFSDYLWVAYETGVTVDKDVDWLWRSPEQVLKYTVTLDNLSGEDALGVHMFDPLSEYLIIDESSITTSGSIDDAFYAGGAVHWIGDIPVGGTVVVTFECAVSADAPHGWALINAAMIIDSENAYPEVWYESAATEIFGSVLFLPIIAK
jgi:uncharacterized repeat protein (TIGR01451 family)